MAGKVLVLAVIAIVFCAAGDTNLPPAGAVISGGERDKTQTGQGKAAENEPNRAPVSTAGGGQGTAIERFNARYGELLKEYVDQSGRVDYKALKRRRTDLAALQNELYHFDPNQYRGLPEQVKIAFWLNAYNLQLLNIVVQNYPIQASRVLSVIWGPYSLRHLGNIWQDARFIIMDEQFTLSEIETRFFEKQFAEPLVFFALSRASVSGPAIREEPYCGDRLSRQLDDQTRKFLASPRAFRIDREKQRVYFSSILQPNWFGNFFVGKYGTDKKFKDKPAAVRAVLNFVCRYVPQQDASYLEVGNYTVEYIRYNWTLNDK